MPAHDGAVPCASHLDEALRAFEEALALIDEDERPASYGVVLHDIAQTYEVAERFEVGAELYRESVVFKRRGGNHADISTTLVALAQCLSSCGRPEEAHTAVGEASEALGLAAPGLPAAKLASRLHEIGRLYERLGGSGIASAYDDAVAAFERALEVVDREVDPKSYATVVSALGDVYFAMGRLPAAVSAYSTAVSVLRGTDDRTGLLNALIDLGRANRWLAEADGERFLDVAAAAQLAARWRGGPNADGHADAHAGGSADGEGKGRAESSAADDPDERPAAAE